MSFPQISYIENDLEGSEFGANDKFLWRALQSWREQLPNQTDSHVPSQNVLYCAFVEVDGLKDVGGEPSQSLMSRFHHCLCVKGPNHVKCIFMIAHETILTFS